MIATDAVKQTQLAFGQQTLCFSSMATYSAGLATVAAAGAYDSFRAINPDETGLRCAKLKIGVNAVDCQALW